MNGVSKRKNNFSLYNVAHLSKTGCSNLFLSTFIVDLIALMSFSDARVDTVVDKFSKNNNKFEFRFPISLIVLFSRSLRLFVELMK